MIDYDAIRRFYDTQRGDSLDDPDFLRGTVEGSVGVARFRFRAEARHLARVVRVEPGQQVLDLGGATGRHALWFAERGARVTLVELAPSSVEAARRNVARRGLSGVECLQGSILAPPIAAGSLYDIVHVGGVLVYINDADLPRVAEVAREHCRPGGRLIVREPVDPRGRSEDVRPGGYRALYRRPSEYAALFRDGFELSYQRTTVSHLVPPGQSTVSAVAAATSSPLRRRLVDTLLPLAGYVDYHLLGLEEAIRASVLAPLLGDPGVVTHYYVFRRR